MNCFNLLGLFKLNSFNFVFNEKNKNQSGKSNKVIGIWNKVLETIQFIFQKIKMNLGDKNWKILTSHLENLFYLFFPKKEVKTPSVPMTEKKVFPEDSTVKKAAYEVLLQKAPAEGIKVAKLFLDILPTINMSNLIASGLSHSDIQTISTHAASLNRLDEFILKNPVSQEKVTILGTSFNHLIFDFEGVFKSRDFLSAYFELTGSFCANTPLFLTKLAEEGKPVILLIPYDLSQAHTTADEIKWFINHPDKMKNVHFIYGTYDVLKQSSFGLVDPQFDELELSVFRSSVFEYSLKEVVNHYRSL